MLKGIRDAVTVWAGKSFIKLIFKRNDIADDVKRHHNEINIFLENFGLAVHIETQRRLKSFDRHRQEDKNEIISFLSDSRNKTQITQEIIVAGYEEVKGTMTEMQEVYALFRIDF